MKVGSKELLIKVAIEDCDDTPLLNSDNYNEISWEIVDFLDSLYEDDPKLYKGEKFEIFLEKLFQLSGYSTKRTPPVDDGGIDLYIEKGVSKYAIQAKKRALKTQTLFGVDDIRKLNGVNTADYKKVFITTHFFTDAAINEAKATGTELIDKIGLFRLIGQLVPQLLAKGYLRQYMKDLGFCEKCGAPMTIGYGTSLYYQCLNSRTMHNCNAKSISEYNWNAKNNI